MAFAFDINIFRGVYANGGWSQRAQFSVAMLGVPQKAALKYSTSQIQFMCHYASIPGRQLNTIPYRAYGQPRQIVSGPTNESPLTLGFYLTDGLPLHDMFKTWMEMAVSGETGNAGYYSDYAEKSSIDVQKFSQLGFRSSIYTYEEAYPIDVNKIDMDWGNVNQGMQLEVTFAYRRWSIKDGPS